MVKEVEVKLDAAEIVVERVLEMLKEGVVPWKKPFKTGHINWITKTQYKGLNLFLLYGGSGEYITFKQLQDYNKANGTTYKIKKGTKMRTIYVYKPRIKLATQAMLQKIQRGETVRGLFKNDDGDWCYMSFTQRYFNVVDIVHIFDDEGNPLPSKFATGELKDVKANPEKVIKKYLENEGMVVHASEVAAYVPSTDSFKMPPLSKFKTSRDYHAVFFHEMIHSTGHSSRINRPELNDYHNSMEIRGAEELIAEIGSAITMIESGYEIEELDVENTAAYIAHWAGWIKENRRDFAKACAKAHKASDYIFYGKTVSKQAEGDSETIQKVPKDISK